MKLFLSPNLFTEEQRAQALECIEVLKQKEDTMLSLSLEDSLTLYQNESAVLFAPSDCDLIVSLGGDGAVLRAAQYAIASDKPLIGINSGRLGFLCSIPFIGIQHFYVLLESGNITHRALLECSYKGETYYALNDVTIGKPNFGETVDLTICVDNEGIGKVRGDGLIISTPTGSTAYNRSAGGPLLDPESSSILMTPICSRNSITRPIVLGDKRVISVTERQDCAQLYVDGKPIGTLDSEVTIKKSVRTLSLYAPENTIRHMIQLV